jgi:hypothetical protein
MSARYRRSATEVYILPCVFAPGTAYDAYLPSETQSDRADRLTSRPRPDYFDIICSRIIIDFISIVVDITNEADDSFTVSFLVET